uniref:Uncharacterized protein n=1 Tax=Anopheles coluzzii TaxID=1518534 RepID=A0A8W7Q1G4_ANOCL
MGGEQIATCLGRRALFAVRFLERGKGGLELFVRILDELLALLVRQLEHTAEEDLGDQLCQAYPAGRVIHHVREDHVDPPHRAYRAVLHCQRYPCLLEVLPGQANLADRSAHAQEDLVCLSVLVDHQRPAGQFHHAVHALPSVRMDPAVLAVLEVPERLAFPVYRGFRSVPCLPYVQQFLVDPAFLVIPPGLCLRSGQAVLEVPVVPVHPVVHRFLAFRECLARRLLHAFLAGLALHSAQEVPALVAPDVPSNQEHRAYREVPVDLADQPDLAVQPHHHHRPHHLFRAGRAVHVDRVALQLRRVQVHPVHHAIPGILAVPLGRTDREDPEGQLDRPEPA